MILPIEIINKILDYKSDLTDELITIRYNTVTQEEYYKINKSSDFLWKLKSLMIMKRLYPLLTKNVSDYDNRQMYNYGLIHYENTIKNNIYPYKYYN